MVRLSAGGKPGAVEAVSAPGRGAKYAELAVDPRGCATVVWQLDDGVSTRAQAVRQGANGKPGRVRTLSAPGRAKHANACCPQVAVDGRGRDRGLEALRRQAVPDRGDALAVAASACPPSRDGQA